ncbi:MAG: hypothetical protein ACKVOE_09715 [Rickettsiales bacterium]
MKPMTTALALAAMLLCSACADNGSKTSNLATNDKTIQVVTATSWEYATAAQTAARVNNNFLIQQR